MYFKMTFALLASAAVIFGVSAAESPELSDKDLKEIHRMANDISEHYEKAFALVDRLITMKRDTIMPSQNSLFMMFSPDTKPETLETVARAINNRFPDASTELYFTLTLNDDRGIVHGLLAVIREPNPIRKFTERLLGRRDPDERLRIEPHLQIPRQESQQR
jgi:hypothetical protein